ncbi:stabilin-2-like [Notothenia coriiceps]|uniref:Stabilin-2-like n=1 Tax=Notothenia coriiceps TaxID=8208 RepID=A0A6I9NUH0_9TELE|nr:PREDICTED: stabilin-2-like [Notothenia coriiceps]
MGNGIECDLINPCLEKNGGCHDLAKCEFSTGGTHTCTCPDGYAGDGTLCYGTLPDELEMNPLLMHFKQLRHRDLTEDLSGNLTLLIPVRGAMVNMTTAQTDFWTSRHHLPLFIRSVASHTDHILVADTPFPPKRFQGQFGEPKTSGLINLSKNS